MFLASRSYLWTWLKIFLNWLVGRKQKIKINLLSIKVSYKHAYILISFKTLTWDYINILRIKETKLPNFSQPWHSELACIFLLVFIRRHLCIISVSSPFIPCFKTGSWCLTRLAPNSWSSGLNFVHERITALVIMLARFILF